MTPMLCVLGSNTEKWGAVKKAGSVLGVTSGLLPALVRPPELKDNKEALEIPSQMEREGTGVGAVAWQVEIQGHSPALGSQNTAGVALVCVHVSAKANVYAYLGACTCLYSVVTRVHI